MAFITSQKQTATPATPASGYARLYFEGASLKYIDETGTVYTLSTGITEDDVEDIVGGLVTNTASVQWVYNDAANTLTADVLASGVNHNALQNYVANQHIDHSTVSITAGTGLTGGGSIAASRTISLANTSVTPSSYGSAAQVATFTVDAQGRLTAAATTPISISSSAVTDFGEAAQDAIGAALLDSASIDFTYNDVANTISATVLPAGVNHNALQNYVANQHIDHGSVSINPGTGLTGGGTIAASRTLSIADTGVTAGTYGSGSAFPIFTVNAQGQITSASQATVSAIFGSEYQAFTDDTPATTTSTTFSVAAGFTTVSVPAGAYRIAVSFAYRHSVTNSDTRFRLVVNGTQVGPALRREPSESTNQSFLGYIVENQTFASSASHTIDLQFAVETGGLTTTCLYAFFEFWRIS